MARERKDRREADARASKKEAAGKAPVKGKKRKAVEMIGDVLEEGVSYQSDLRCMALIPLNTDRI